MDTIDHSLCRTENLRPMPVLPCSGMRHWQSRSSLPSYLWTVVLGHFEGLLGDAVNRARNLQPQQVHDLHMPGLAGDSDNPRVDEIEAPPWKADGNSVYPEREMTRLTENSLLFGAVARGLNTRMKILRFAATDGRG